MEIREHILSFRKVAVEAVTTKDVLIMTKIKTSAMYINGDLDDEERVFLESDESTQAIIDILHGYDVAAFTDELLEADVDAKGRQSIIRSFLPKIDDITQLLEALPEGIDDLPFPEETLLQARVMVCLGSIAAVMMDLAIVTSNIAQLQYYADAAVQYSDVADKLLGRVHDVPKQDDWLVNQ